MNIIALNNVRPLLFALLQLSDLRNKQLDTAPHEKADVDVLVRATLLLKTIYELVPEDALDKAIAYAVKTRSAGHVDVEKPAEGEDHLAHTLALFLMLANVNSEPLDEPEGIEIEKITLRAMLFQTVASIFHDTGLSLEDFTLLTGAPVDAMTELLNYTDAIASKAET